MSSDIPVDLVKPGRLGNPENLLCNDPRADPRMVDLFAKFGMDKAPTPCTLTTNSRPEEIHAAWEKAEVGFTGLFDALFAGLPEILTVDRETVTIKGVDDNDIKLFVHKPKSMPEGTLCVLYHTHGGGMSMLSATNLANERLRDELASMGVVCVGVEFRNSSGKLGPHPFPAGLNDCVSGLKWTVENFKQAKVIITGESGGGNLALASGLKAKRDGIKVDGIFALCPMISNLYHKKGDEAKKLPSLWENDKLFLDVYMMSMIAHTYTLSDQKQATNPLAWPLFATVQELEGFPPTVISVNELDPLRDEGLAFYRKLKQAKVPGYAVTVLGTAHGMDILLPSALPEVYAETKRSMVSFAQSLPSPG